ncbi:MAG: pyruvate kinase [Planctomycetaceae bacterium]|nr:pyruvate kinase [Planctomycetaceae bacterium]
MPNYTEPSLTKTKIVATVGPASNQYAQLKELVAAGVDVFRLNFAHADYDVLSQVVQSIREIAVEIDRPIGILGDLAGPKIRLGELPEEGLRVHEGEHYSFVHENQANPADRKLTCSYTGLIQDLKPGDRILLADGMVSMVVQEVREEAAVCEVDQGGRIHSRQGINLPNSQLQLPSLTDKDLKDLEWALANGLDFLGLSFVRTADDIRDLRRRIDQASPKHKPLIIAKFEKPAAVENLEAILEETDAAMVARGDLGVEVDIVRVPGIQKQIIRACNRRRVPVITATQMLESMQQNELPTRAEATDVANAVLDGTDAVMLSAETAVGRHPATVVQMMSRIVREVEPLVPSRKDLPLDGGVQSARHAATELTKALTLGAIYTAEKIRAKMLVVLTQSGVTAAAVSELRSGVPILALTDNPRTAQLLTLVWGVRGVVTGVCQDSPLRVANFAVGWGRQQGVLSSGDRFVIVGTTDWSMEGKNLVLVHVVP